MSIRVAWASTFITPFITVSNIKVGHKQINMA